jgi:hypothetical protein
MLSWVPHPPVLRVRLLIYTRVPTSLHPVSAVTLSSNAVAGTFPSRHYARARSKTVVIPSAHSSSVARWRTCLRTSGQNSIKVFAPIRPKIPETILNRVSAGSVSLLGRHISESTLLPASATKRAYAGPRCPSLYRAVNVSLIAFRTRLPNGWPGNRSYRGSSPQIAPNQASIPLPIATPVSRTP